jgi:hypothetical protein
MMSEAKRLRGQEPLPELMQGRWVDVDESTAELVIDGGEISCFGSTVDYDFKEIVEAEGALTVSLHIDAGLVVIPELKTSIRPKSTARPASSRASRSR